MKNLFKNATILVIEDDSDALELLRVILSNQGANVLVAGTVEKALALCRTNPPHLVVSDMRLGNSDGFALIEALREYNREYRSFTPAIAITGLVSAGDEARALAAGFNAYVHKPFDPDGLVRMIGSLLADNGVIAA